MVASVIPQLDSEQVVGEVGNVSLHLLGDGFADRVRTPSQILSEIPKGSVHKYVPTAPADPEALPTVMVPPMAASAASLHLRRGCSLVEFVLDEGRRRSPADHTDDEANEVGAP
jgi:polyhydroxyalkanoate synthase